MCYFFSGLTSTNKLELSLIHKLNLRLCLVRCLEYCTLRQSFDSYSTSTKVTTLGKNFFYSVLFDHLIIHTTQLPMNNVKPPQKTLQTKWVNVKTFPKLWCKMMNNFNSWNRQKLIKFDIRMSYWWASFPGTFVWLLFEWINLSIRYMVTSCG